MYENFLCCGLNNLWYFINNLWYFICYFLYSILIKRDGYKKIKIYKAPKAIKKIFHS